MNYNETNAVTQPIRLYLNLTDRLGKAIASINEKTSSFQSSPEQSVEKIPASQSEFENRLRILVERAEDIDNRL